jgi:hypothetical protein
MTPPAAVGEHEPPPAADMRGPENPRPRVRSVMITSPPVKTVTHRHYDALRPECPTYRAPTSSDDHPAARTPRSTDDHPAATVVGVLLVIVVVGLVIAFPIILAVAFILYFGARLLLGDEWLR